MKSLYYYVGVTMLLVAVFSSCTIEKRLFQRGYHVEWNKRARTSDSHETTVDQPVSQQNLRLQEDKTEIVTETSAIIPEREASSVVRSTDAVNTSETETRLPKTTTDSKTTEAVDLQQQDSGSKIEQAMPDSNTKSKSRKPATALRGLGFLGLAFLFFLMSLLFILISGPLGTTLCVLFIMAGVIFLIIGFVVLIKAAVTKGE